MREENMDQKLVEIRKLMREADWKGLRPRLVLYADNQIKKHWWKGAKGGSCPEGKTGDDYVTLAMGKLYKGKRNWDPHKVTLFRILKGIISSDISHDTDCVENHRERCEASLDAPDDDESFVSQLPGRSLTPAEECERNERSQQVMMILIDLVSQDDPDLIGLIECFWDEKFTPLEMAEKIKVSVKEVNNRQKRLRRILIRYGKEELLEKFNFGRSRQ